MLIWPFNYLRMQRIINLLIFGLILLNSCTKKEDSTPLDPTTHQIDYLLIPNDIFNRYDTIKNIRYNAEGKLIEFGNEKYAYNASDKVNRIDCRIGHVDVNTPYIILDYHYDLSYDSQGRMIGMSEAKFEKPSTDIISIPALVPSSFKLVYEADMKIPATMEQGYYAPMFGDTFLTHGNVVSMTQKSVFLRQGGNIAERIVTVKGKLGGKWEPGLGEDFEKTTHITYEYDDKPNVFQQLFGSLGFVPKPFIGRYRLDQSIYYSKNNITRLRNGEQSLSISYSYDSQGRVTDINMGTTASSIKVFYKK